MDVNDDILGLVLERVDSHISLIRAAAVCRRWRRLPPPLPHPPRATRRRILRPRRRRTPCHGPGVFFFPSSPPVVDARHLSLDFLPGGACSWTIQDSRGSLLLLREGSYTHFPYRISGMVVCEPMSRRYIRIHPPTDLDDRCYRWEFYLIDGEPNETGGCINMSNFRVLCMFDKHGAMYTVGSSWSKKNIDHIAPTFSSLFPMGRGGGCWYFVQGRAMIVLDCSTGDFSSSSELPPFVEDWDYHLSRHDFFITNGRDGKLCIFIVFDGTMNLFVRLEGGEWALEKRVLLLEATHGLPGCKPSYFSGPQYVLGVGAGYAILLPCIGEQLIFSINIETMEVAPVVNTMTLKVYGCELPWPPTFQACLDG